jgi:NitT/TauT family transport system permease protein
MANDHQQTTMGDAATADTLSLDLVPEKRRVIKRARRSEALKMLIPFVGIFIAFAVQQLVPNVYPVGYTPVAWPRLLLSCAAIYAVLWLLGLFVAPLRNKLVHFSWLLAFIFLFFEAYDLLTVKSGYLRMPFMPSPSNILETLVQYHSRVFNDARTSLVLLGTGLSLGLAVGFISGVLVGCSRIANYWISPLLKIVGPVPGLIWLPIFVVGFHSSRVGSVAAIVLSVWFPMTLMLGNAIRNTDVGLIERAQTMGASKPYIVLHVMIPAAIPALANALFMALAGSFGALAAAEMAGVRGGLALAVRQWGTQAHFGMVFSYVIVMIIIFSSLTIIMFAVRNWLLRWQKGLVRW